MSRTTLAAAILAIAVAAAIAPTRARAQLRAMGLPLPTTLVLSKPAPGQFYGNRQTVTMGVGGKSFEFVLKDAWVDDPTGRVRWPDVWEQVRQHHPNFQATGMGSGMFEKIKPGDTLTVRGVYTPLNRNFEVTGTQTGGEPAASPQHY